MLQEMDKEVTEINQQIDELIGIPKELPSSHRERLIRLSNENGDKLVSKDKKIERFIEFFKDVSLEAAAAGRKTISIPYTCSGEPEYITSIIDGDTEICSGDNYLLGKIQKMLEICGYKVSVYYFTSRDIVISWDTKPLPNGYKVLIPLCVLPILAVLNGIFGDSLYSIHSHGSSLLAGAGTVIGIIGSIIGSCVWKDKIRDEIRCWRN